MQATSRPHPFHLRSFIRRDSRITAAQKHALTTLWSDFGLPIATKEWNFAQIFANGAPCFVEIGFGFGQSLLALAKAHADKNFIGIETHKPGIGALLIGIKKAGLTNLRIVDGDAVDVFKNAVPDASLAGVQLFFPDPWQKRRHHGRRLIQKEFVQLIVQKCQSEASLHVATDWQDYAYHIMTVLTQEKRMRNLALDNHFSGRSPYRPILTKFEQRAIQAHRAIWELQFKKL